jgi:hypothetical protein
MDGLSTQASSECKEMLSSLGIAKLSIPPGLHRANGLAENAIRKTRAMAKSIFHEMGNGIPKKYFHVAVSFAVNAHNLLPCKGNTGGVSPFEMKYGRKPNVRDIPILPFASVIAKNLDVKKMGSPSSINGIYMGEAGENAIKVWNPATDKIVIRSDVVTNEKRSTYPDDRIELMMRGLQVHSTTARTFNSRIRQQNDERSITIKRTPVAEHYKGRKIEFWLLTMNNAPIAKGAYECNICEERFDKPQGIHLHFSKQHPPTTNVIAGIIGKDIQEANAKDAIEAGARPRSGLERNGIQEANAKDATEAGARPRSGLERNGIQEANAKDATEAGARPRSGLERNGIQEANAKDAIEAGARPRMDSNEKTSKSRVQGTNGATCINCATCQKNKTMCKRCIDNEYEKLKTTKELDPDRQWDPNEYETGGVTLRKIFNVKDEDSMIFERTSHDYRGAPECADEIDGSFCFGNFEIPRDKSGNIIRSPEIMQRLTPKSMSEVERSPYREELLDALQTEIDTLNQYNVFSDTTKWKPFGKNTIKLKVIFKAKWKTGTNGEPEFVKWKARIVARGFSAVEGIDYDPTRVSSPVGRASSYMLTLAEAAAKDMLLFYFDIKAAYLLTKTHEEIWIELPKGLEIHDGDEGKYCRLLRYLYGLKTSGFEWHETFSKFLFESGFERSRNDPCMFTLRTRDGNIMRMILYVDDALCATTSESLWDEIRTSVDAKFKMSEHGPLTNILGMSVVHDRKNKVIRINQRLKIEALLERHQMHEMTAKPLTPLAPGRKADRADMPTNAEEEEREAALATSPRRPEGFRKYLELVMEYLSLLGSLSHIATWGRNDIKQAVYLLARHQSRPSARDYKSALRILNYLKGTKNLEMVLGAIPYNEESPMTAMVDSNFDTPSTTGFVITIWGSVIHAESRKQGAIARSTMEAELIAASQCTAMVKYLRRVMVEDFRCDLPATPMGEDNTGCIGVAQGGGNHKRRRHIRVADAWIYQEVALAKTIELYHVRSNDNVADMFTKSLESPAFIKFRDMIMGMANPKDDQEQIAILGSVEE